LAKLAICDWADDSAKKKDAATPPHSYCLLRLLLHP